MNKIIETPTIVCPVCGQEMLPAEIYMPDSFFGKPGEIIRDASGKIEFFTGDDMDLCEEYTCDNCNTVLGIKANLSFTVEAHPVDEFEEEYVSTYSKPKKIILTEEELF